MPHAAGSWPSTLTLAVALKSVAQPLVAWVLAAGVFGLRGAQLLDVVVTSALPAAQNLFTYASSYGVGERLARDSILVSTVLSGAAGASASCARAGAATHNVDNDTPSANAVRRPSVRTIPTSLMSFIALV